MRILSNLPLPAETHTVRTFGDYLPAGAPPWRPEKERRALADILPRIPLSERPDALVFSSPEYLPIPQDVADFPGLRILLITDWNMCLRFLPDLCGLFDYCFVDWPGYRLLRRAGVGNVHHQPMFGHDPAVFLDRGGPRPLDLSFCGNLNAGMHRARNRLLARLAKWAGTGEGRSIRLRQAFGAEYTDTLNRSRLVFNYSIRGEANMRLYEAMACGAVPLVEAGNQEVPMLFTRDRHYFGYEPGRLEECLDALLAEPDRIRMVAREAQAAVAAHSKAKQIQSLLDFTGREAPLGSPARPPRPEAAALASAKALVKARVLGADYTMAEALSELQARDPALPGLAAETLPAALLTLLEDHPAETLSAAESMLERMLSDPGMPPLVNALFGMRLHALRGRWQGSLEAAGRGLRILEKEFGAESAESDESVETTESIKAAYRYFHPPIGLGRGAATDMNAAFRDDLETGSRLGYLGLMRARCLAGQALALLALDRPAQARASAEAVPGDRFVSLDPYPLLYRAGLKLGDAEGVRRVLRAWFAERPLDTAVWDQVAEGLDQLGDGPGWIAFLGEIVILARHFLTPAQAETLETRLGSRRGA